MTSIQVEEPITILNSKMRIIMPFVGAEEPLSGIGSYLLIQYPWVVILSIHPSHHLEVPHPGRRR